MKYAEYIKEMPHGLVAVERSNYKSILHICFYEKPPTYGDYCLLYDELSTDETFGLTKRQDIVIVPIPKEMHDILMREDNDRQD